MLFKQIVDFVSGIIRNPQIHAVVKMHRKWVVRHLVLHCALSAVIRNLCATSWYHVCRKFLLEIVFKYEHIYSVKFVVCHNKILIYLFASICTFHIYKVGYEVYHHPPFLLIGLHNIGRMCKLINFNQYKLRVYIDYASRIFVTTCCFVSPFRKA
jgi:hypothetical protein